jgi:3D (Asp-Asp-Asp) domain-containing protein
MKIGNKKYKKTGGGLLGIIDKTAKPLGVLLVAALLLAAYSWAAADELQTRKLQATSAVETKTKYIQTDELAEDINQMVNSEMETASEEEPQEWISLGEFEITAYCPCETCCGSYADGITASGHIAQEGITVAADTSLLPYGTEIMIDGEEYIVQDCGGAINGNRIDIFFADHKTALSYGRQIHEVFVRGE